MVPQLGGSHLCQQVMVGVCTTLQTTAGQAFGARNFQEVSLSLQRCVLFLVGGMAVGDGHPPKKVIPHEVMNLVGGGFKYFVFSRIWGRWTHFDTYFSKGLVQPPTSLRPWMVRICYTPSPPSSVQSPVLPSKAVLRLPFPRLGLVVQQSQIAAGRRSRRCDCWDGGGVFAHLISWALLLHGDTMPSVGIPSWERSSIWWFLDGSSLFRKIRKLKRWCGARISRAVKCYIYISPFQPWMTFFFCVGCMQVHFHWFMSLLIRGACGRCWVSTGGYAPLCTVSKELVGCPTSHWCSR